MNLSILEYKTEPWTNGQYNSNGDDAYYLLEDSLQQLFLAQTRENREKNNNSIPEYSS